MEEILAIPEIEEINKNFEDGYELKKSNFDILKQLGFGSFGKVYKTISKKTKNFYALKKISKYEIIRLNLWEQLKNEIKILAICKNDNIMKLHGVFHDKNKIYLLTELCDQNLFKKLNKKKFFTERETYDILKDVIKTFVYLHSMNPPILHRDLKPENIMFKNDKIKIIDFGWSNINKSFRNTYCGSPDYLSPEMIKGVGHDEKLDIWTIGILMYELLHGKPPFQPKEDIRDRRLYSQTIQMNVIKGNICFKNDLSKEAIECIKVMLSADPKKRPTAKETLDLKFFTRFRFFNK